MADPTPLTQLCSICNASKSKYRCPGCAARTCSLPCYKRHQQWAQCSGIRDPAKFVKKSQLATPAGIDHDFNFLTSIERSLEKADRAVSATAAGPQPDPQPAKFRARGEIQYHRLEAIAGVTIIRAPKGLSRQAENRSHPSSRKAKNNLVWTVEWIDDAKRHVRTETSSTCPLAAAQPFGRHKSRKRKLGPASASSASSSPSTRLQHVAPPTANQDSPVKPLEQELPVNDQQQPEHPPARPGAADPAQEGLVQEPARGEGDVETTHAGDALHDGPVAQSLGHEQHRFYLLRPRTTSSRRVLVPVSPSTTFADCLRGRTILEFPTIYVFSGANTQLPEDFMLEDDYVRQEGEEQREFDELMKGLDPDIVRRLKDDRPAGEVEKEEEVDSKRILDVLKQDLGAQL